MRSAINNKSDLLLEYGIKLVIVMRGVIRMFSTFANCLNFWHYSNWLKVFGNLIFGMWFHIYKYLIVNNWPFEMSNSSSNDVESFTFLWYLLIVFQTADIEKYFKLMDFYMSMIYHNFVHKRMAVPQFWANLSFIRPFIVK